MIFMGVSPSHVNPGRWRVTVEGRLGEETWRSEPIEVDVGPIKGE